MTEQTSLVIIVLLAAVVIALFVFNARQKRRHEAERAERKRHLEEIKAKAREQQAQDP